MNALFQQAVAAAQKVGRAVYVVGAPGLPVAAISLVLSREKDGILGLALVAFPDGEVRPIGRPARRAS